MEHVITKLVGVTYFFTSFMNIDWLTFLQLSCICQIVYYDWFKRYVFGLFKRYVFGLYTEE